MEEVVLFAASSELGRRLNLEKTLGLNTAWPKVGQHTISNCELRARVYHNECAWLHWHR